MQEFTVISKLCDPANQQKLSLPLRATLEKDYTYVSISHKRDQLVGIGSSIPCGIDIESRVKKHPTFTGFVLTESESKIIDDPVIGWSIKESCYKVFNDNYETSDYVITSTSEGNYLVHSENHTYTVTTVLTDSYVTSIAFVSSDDKRYSSL